MAITDTLDLDGFAALTEALAFDKSCQIKRDTKTAAKGAQGSYTPDFQNVGTPLLCMLLPDAEPGENVEQVLDSKRIVTRWLVQFKRGANVEPGDIGVVDGREYHLQKPSRGRSGEVLLVYKAVRFDKREA